MTTRSVTRIIPATRTVEGAGFIVHRPFPTRAVDHVDPFLLLDEMGPLDVRPGEAKGAPDHPHRGFETVTYLLEGSMEHEDSAGNRGKLSPGDVQWMTAGSGVIHSEEPSRAMLENGGRMHGFQLWVNLPAQHKMAPPRYQEVKSAQIPVVRTDGVTLRVIAGTHAGTRAVIETTSPITYVHATLEAGRTVDIGAAAAHNAMVYVISGEGRVGDARQVGRAQLAVFAHDGDTLHIEAGAPGLDVLVLTGAPLEEPVWRAGPFVMSTREELMRAFDDYRSGRFASIAR